MPLSSRIRRERGLIRFGLVCGLSLSQLEHTVSAAKSDVSQQADQSLQASLQALQTKLDSQHAEELAAQLTAQAC